MSTAQALDPYRELGGEAGVRELVDRFYDQMEFRSEAGAIRSLHAEDLADMRERLALFLCGWLGGPPLHTQRYGPLCMRTAHAPFPIDADASAQWMACMVEAFEEVPVRDELRAALAEAFTRTAEMLRNDHSAAGDRERSATQGRGR